MASSRRDWSLALQCLQVIDDLVHLLRFELELRHRCMTSSNSFPERLLKVFERVPLVQIAERRRFRHWAVAVSPNRVTGRAVYLNDGAPFSLVRRLVGSCKRAKRRDGEQDQMDGHEALPTWLGAVISMASSAGKSIDDALAVDLKVKPILSQIRGRRHPRF